MKIILEQTTDKELMKQVAARNAQALKVLYQRYEMQIFNFILRFTGSREIAQELLQETFTRLWLAAHTFDSKRGHFKGWLYAIALNLVRNEMSKKEYTYQFLEADDMVARGQAHDDLQNQDPAAALEQGEFKASIASALGKLESHLREVIVMKHYQHLKFREIAEVTNLPESTLKARYHKAIAELKKYLAPMEE